ncbi:MAG: hypothetical protein JXA10_11600 [Anaerolineae bacterium]|nr:hypothetical protein [Anaerolineae bacterium]
MNRGRRGITSLMIVVLLGAVLAGPIQAREPAPQDTGYIISYQTEIIFPVAISFSVIAAIEQDQIEAATLSYFQRGTILATIELDLDEAVLQTTDVYTQMVYLLELDSDAAPVPFEPVSYRWEIVTQDEIVSMVSDEFTFEDQSRGSWRVAGRPPVVLHWTDWGMAGELMRNDLLPVYTLLEQNTQRALDFQFVLYDTNTRYCQEITDPTTEETRQVVISRLNGTEFPCSKAEFASFYTHVGLVFLERPNAGYTPTLDALTQHMTQAAYALVWENRFVPAWFRAGMGFIYRQRSAPEMLSTARNAARMENLLAIEDLSAALPDTASLPEQDLWNAQSYLLVLYLVDQFGAETVFDLAQTAGEGDFEGALFALIDGDDRVLWDNWYHWLLWEEADAAVTWTPYASQVSN